MTLSLKYLSILLVSLGVAACSSFQTPPDADTEGAVDSHASSTPVSAGGPDHSETGIASFYANKFELRKTASGELYKHDLKTAAHKTLPFGKIVKVTNLDNGKSVIVRVNDRGPFVRGRVIDLSKSAFSSIASLSKGLVKVKIDVVE